MLFSSQPSPAGYEAVSAHIPGMHIMRHRFFAPGTVPELGENSITPQITQFFQICQDSCPTRADKDAHERQAKHKKKLQIYDFFAKEVPKFQPFSGPSVLVKRYTGCGELYVGLECLHELHFSFSPMPWWACSICYESGALMEQADIHLSSMGHITTYLDEFHSTKASTLKTDGDPLKVFEEIKRLCSEIFEEQGLRS
ncbi:unnamed protein product [Heligmosomoides polygyrus]|uniref:C2H2-type domain-containing protein n=1 Tax=Heligmosomoides polygyrus TaxID=6339 RepID=A0A183GTL0_HELPZ|nr:unnamed protein product [Heligmosomoides polygyrus]